MEKYNYIYATGTIFFHGKIYKQKQFNGNKLETVGENIGTTELEDLYCG